MASPQVQDGYTPFANDLLEAIICGGFSQRELVLILVVARATYGWSQKTTTISKLELIRRSGLDPSDGYKTIRDLKGRNVLIEDKKGLGIQKNYELWQSCTRGKSPLGVKHPYQGQITPSRLGKSPLPTRGKSPLVSSRERPSSMGLRAPKSIFKSITKTNKASFVEKAFWEKFSPEDQEVIRQTIQAINSTRKRGRVADSIIQAEMQWWDRQDPAQVIQGMRTYLQKDYAAQGKREEYLRGIIRHSDQESPASAAEIGELDGFETFWAAYPSKIGQRAALRAWKKVTGVSLEKILEAIQIQKQSEKWQEKNGKYIPHPATWLGDGRWDDEVPSRSKRQYGPAW